MAGLLTPEIGSAGIFTLLAPYSTLLTQDVSYTCIGVRTLDDIRASGIDPKVAYYDPYEIDQTKYEADVAAGVKIISLKPASGVPVYVPNTYIASFPAAGGVPYAVLGLAISLGAVPEAIDLSGLNAQLVQVIHDTIGVSVQIKQVKLSETTLVEQSTSASMEAARQLQITTRSTDRSKLIEAQATILALQQKNSALEAWIVAHSAADPAPTP